MPRLHGMPLLLLLTLVLSACGIIPSSNFRDAPKEIGYDPVVLTPPAQPQPIDGDWRRDAAARLALQEMDRPLLVFIYDDMCGNCIAMRPHIHQLENDYWGQIDVAYLARDDFTNLGYEIFNFIGAGEPPEFLFVAPDQTVIAQWQGAPSLDELRGTIDAYLAEGDE